MVGFEEGYTYFENNASAYAAAAMSDSYVVSVNDEIEKLVKDLNSLMALRRHQMYLKEMSQSSGIPVLIILILR